MFQPTACNPHLGQTLQGALSGVRHGIMSAPCVTESSLLVCDPINSSPGHPRKLCSTFRKGNLYKPPAMRWRPSLLDIDCTLYASFSLSRCMWFSYCAFFSMYSNETYVPPHLKSKFLQPQSHTSHSVDCFSPCRLFLQSFVSESTDSCPPPVMYSPPP